METEIIESVLKEILEEQKAGLQVNRELSTNIDNLTSKIENIHQKLELQKAPLPPADTRLVQAIVSTGIRQIQEIVEAQPKNAVRQFRFLLFPEQFAEQYYRIVFGRLLFWMMIFLLSTYLFALGRQGIQSWKMVQLKNLEADHARAAFDYLYQHADKEGKKKMIDAWNRSRKTN